MKLQLALLAVLLTLLSFVAGDCCPSDDGVCDDGTQATPCCGYRPCNVFCCNCECRKSFNTALDEVGHFGHGSHSLAQTGGDAHVCLEKFGSADANGDGKLTFLEWVRSPTAASIDSLPVLAAHWEMFDVDGKGYLTMDEALMGAA